jgi:hypothetical protein
MTLPELGISQAMCEQTRRQSHAVCDTEPDENPAEVGPHRAPFQTEDGGDLLVLITGENQFDDPSLLRREVEYADQFTTLFRR